MLGYLYLLDGDGDPIDFGGPHGPIDGEYVQDLLPGNSTAWERAVGEAMSDRLPVPYREIMDPLQTPAAWLPFLAAHRSVDLWYSDWSLERKRQMVANAVRLARLKGTRQGTIEFLAYVDAELLDVISYPTRFVLGRAVLGRTPIGHKPFVARHLVRVRTYTAPGSLVLGRSVLGRNTLRTSDRTPLNRAMNAMTIAKSPDTQYRVDFAHKRPIQFSDEITFESGPSFSGYVDRALL